MDETATSKDILDEYLDYKGITLNESTNWLQYRIYPRGICQWYVQYRYWPYIWLDLTPEYFSFKQKAEAWFKEYLSRTKFLKNIQKKNKQPLSDKELLKLNKDFYEETS